MIVVPPWEVVNAIETGQCTIRRRIEFYESDGLTPWYPEGEPTEVQRIVDGSVTVDSTRPERRMADMTLLNSDNLLRPNPNGGFWYDKVIKCFRGIDYIVPISGPKISIVETAHAYDAQKFQVMLKSLGFTRSFINQSAVDWVAADSDVLVSYTSDTATAKSAMLKSQYAAGRGVLTFSVANTEAEVPLIGAHTAVGSQSWGVTPVATDTPVAGDWTAGAASGVPSGNAVTGTAAGALSIAVWSSGGGPSRIAAILQTNTAGGRWVNLQLPDFGSAGIKQLVRACILWLQNYTPTASWETQIGELVIDQLNDQMFPYQIKATTRDYMKRMMNSKIANDETFVTGTSVTDLIIAMARNSGITNTIHIPTLDIQLTTDLSYTRGTARSDIAINAATGIGYSLYFDHKGELRMEPAPDPTLDPTQHMFKTGSDGNLVSLERSTDDSNLKNHIVVYGTPDGGTGIPFVGEAMNTDPSSPTRISRIGDRYDDFEYDTVGSDDQAASIALTLLKVAALETYQVNVSAICYPWLESNIVARVDDPKAYDFEPDKYLMDTLDIPLTLGPMSATAKRITIVGDPGNGNG